MKITRITVGGLFERFNHDLHMSSDARTTIMIGPNGYGKTMILRMLNGLFNESDRSLISMPFRELGLYFDDESMILKPSGESISATTMSSPPV